MQAIIDAGEGRLQARAVGLGLLHREGARRRATTSTRSQLKPYLELDNVLQNGVFYAANQLYGLTFKERKDLPVYDPDVRVFDVFDKDGKHAGALLSPTCTRAATSAAARG